MKKIILSILIIMMSSVAYAKPMPISELKKLIKNHETYKKMVENDIVFISANKEKHKIIVKCYELIFGEKNFGQFEVSLDGKEIAAFGLTTIQKERLARRNKPLVHGEQDLRDAFGFNDYNVNGLLSLEQEAKFLRDYKESFHLGADDDDDEKVYRIYVFTDPDSFACANFFNSIDVNDLKRYSFHVYLFPSPMHKNAVAKSLMILGKKTDKERYKELLRISMNDIKLEDFSKLPKGELEKRKAELNQGGQAGLFVEANYTPYILKRFDLYMGAVKKLNAKNEGYPEDERHKNNNKKRKFFY